MSLWLLRAAEREEIPCLAGLIALADSGVLEVLFFRDREMLVRMMDNKNKDTIFSYKHILVAEKGGMIVGMLFGFDRDIQKATQGMTGRALWNNLGWARFLWLLPGLLILEWHTRFKNGDFYVSSVAVDPDERGSGIGASLLMDIECRNYKRIVLDVAEENSAAIRFYERLGYLKERSWWFLGKKYLRMVKVLKATAH